MTAAEGAYTGADNLEVMREARNYNAWLLRLIHGYAPRHGQVLDFGAGSGTFALPMQRARLTVTCLEPDEALQCTLRAQGLTVVPTLESLADSTFDFIYSLNVLEHLDDDGAALAGLHTKLKPGGRLFIYVPAFEVLYGSMDRKVGHLRRYRRAELARRIRNAGFAVEQSRYADCVGFFAALAFRAFDNSAGDLNPVHVRLYDRFAFPVSLVLDYACSPFFGKNVMALARRQGSGNC